MTVNLTFLAEECLHTVVKLPLIRKVLESAAERLPSFIKEFCAEAAESRLNVTRFT